MNNKVILSVAFSLVMSGFAVGAQAEDKAVAPITDAAVTTEASTAKAEVPVAATEVAKDAVSAEGKVEAAPAPAPDVATDTAAESTEPAAVVSEPSVKSATPPMTPIEFSGVTSLRGENALDGMAQVTENKNLPSDRPPIARNYFQQPPLIPHRVREYRITVNNNKCLSCHSWKNAAKAKATKISQTHFADREGNAHSTVAARRYFCNQCHVPQVDAKPLVENEFKPVDDLK